MKEPWKKRLWRKFTARKFFLLFSFSNDVEAINSRNRTAVLYGNLLCFSLFMVFWMQIRVVLSCFRVKSYYKVTKFIDIFKFVVAKLPRDSQKLLLRVKLSYWSRANVASIATYFNFLGEWWCIPSAYTTFLWHNK